MAHNGHGRLLRGWDVALVVGVLLAGAWLAELWVRAGRVNRTAPPPAGSGEAPRDDAARLEALVRETERRLAAVEGRIARLERPPAPGNHEEEAAVPPALREPDPGSALPAMSAWFAPFAAEETLAGIEGAVSLAPGQRERVEAALREFFSGYYRRLADAYADTPGAADPASRDLLDALDRELRAALSAEQYGRYVEWRGRRR